MSDDLYPEENLRRLLRRPPAATGWEETVSAGVAARLAAQRERAAWFPVLGVLAGLVAIAIVLTAFLLAALLWLAPPAWNAIAGLAPVFETAPRWLPLLASASLPPLLPLALALLAALAVAEVVGLCLWKIRLNKS